MTVDTTKRLCLRTVALPALLALAWMGCQGPKHTASSQAGSQQASSSPAAKTGDTRPVATYGSREMTVQQFLDLAAKLPMRSRRALQDKDKRRMFVENHVLQDLVFDDGRKLGYDKDDNIRKQVRDLEHRLVIQKVMLEHQGDPVSDDEIRKYYDSHQGEFSTDRVRASHILIKDKAEAEKVLAELKADPSKFAELAKEHSIDKSNAQKGGDLGYFGKGRMVKEFEDAAFGLQHDGDMTGLVETRFGYHIIKRTGREDGHIRPFDEVKNQIRIRLANERRQAGTEKFLADVKREANLQIDTDVLGSLVIPAAKNARGSAGRRAMPLAGH